MCDANELCIASKKVLSVRLLHTDVHKLAASRGSVTPKFDLFPMPYRQLQAAKVLLATKVDEIYSQE